MGLRRAGGALLVASAALFAASALIAATGTPLRWDAACWQWDGCDTFAGGALGVPHLIVPVAVGLLAIGSAIVGLAGVPRFVGRGGRIGLGMLAFGLLLYLAATNAPMAPGASVSGNAPIILTYLLGVLASLAGFLTIVAALVMRRLRHSGRDPDPAA